MGIVEGGRGLSDLLLGGYSLVTGSETVKSALVSVLILLGFWFLRKAFTRYFFGWIMRIASRTETNIDEKILKAFYKPFQALFLIAGLYLALLYLPLNQVQNDFISQLFRSGIVIVITWGIYALLGADSLLSQEIKEKYNISDILLVFLSRVVRFVLIALALVIIVQEWDYEVNGFIAGLGLGGLAFALAAQDMLANIFGGIIIVVEKPFSIGDWIATPSVEGIVEENNR
jgi:MscS family membrane protein